MCRAGSTTAGASLSDSVQERIGERCCCDIVLQNFMEVVHLSQNNPHAAQNSKQKWNRKITQNVSFYNFASNPKAMYEMG